jgi:MOSC domain-containing protein YiiM
MGSTGAGRLVSINVGLVRSVEWFDRMVETAIWKNPVDGPVHVGPTQIAGDRQADLRVHGGADKAVYAYASEDLSWWTETYGQPFAPGTFGENLTTQGIDVTTALVGERWRIGTTLLEVAQPREPCFKLGIRLGDAVWIDRFTVAGRPGAYLRVLEPGFVENGDAIDVVERPGNGFSVTELLALRGDPDRDLLERVATSEAAPVGWRDKAARALARG